LKKWQEAKKIKGPQTTIPGEPERSPVHEGYIFRRKENNSKLGGKVKTGGKIGIQHGAEKEESQS